MGSSHVKQEVKTQEIEHRDFAGQVTSLPAGHDAWVVGPEPVVVVDWYGASDYAR